LCRVRRVRVETTRPLSEITQITIDDEPAFNTAEAALTEGKVDVAIDGYRKTIDNTTKPWLRQRSATRLLEIGTRNNRFDATAAGYVAIARQDPTAAQRLKPKVPPRTAGTDQVIKDVRRAMDDTRLSAESRQQLMAFLADLQQADGDTRAATRTVEQVQKADPSVETDVVATRLKNAQAALAKKDFAKARAEVVSARSLLTSTDDQALGLFLLAEAQAGIALDRKDTAALKDAAIAYMRVVAHFKQAPGAPHVPDSLFKAAGLLERVGEKDQARELYAEVAAQYPQSPVARDAKSAAGRLAEGR
jgi:TolA-binding protein